MVKNLLECILVLLRADGDHDQPLILQTRKETLMIVHVQH